MTYRTVLKSTALAAVLSTASAFSAQAVFFHIGSGSIDGSLCVGNDCVSSEAFGFDTVRLKENNLRLHFDDTSVAAAFPPNDWRLYANDSANGGSSYFGIEDATAGRFVFRVFAGARSNALTVDSQGDLGLGTTTPATDIDIKIGDTPTVRLQQDGTSGFTPQTWDVAGNEAGFFIRDATSGSTLPFRIITGGAPSQSLVIGDEGDISMGAGTNPDEKLHIESSSEPSIKLEDTGGSIVQIDSEAGGDTVPRVLFNNATAGTEWEIAASDTDTFRISRIGTGVGEFRVDASGNIFSSSLINCSNGIISNASGRLECAP
ncbi:MAG: hypothetical protein QNJ44_21320 [Rhodobacter sp.]|nr:hypothetical protein [Rhodobacter sp.]